MLRNRMLLAIVAGLSLCLAGSPALALTIGVSFVDNTTDNDSGANEQANSSAALSGSSPVVLANTIGATGSVSTRAAGFTASQEQDGGITQSIDYAVTYTVTAPASVVYDITFSPEFHARLTNADQGDVPGDSSSVSVLSAALSQNASSISDSLDLSGGTNTSPGTANVDSTATQNLTGLSGNNTFVLTYTGSVHTQSFDAVLCSGTTYNSVLWGMDGPFGPACSGSADNWDDYTVAAALDADGLFTPAAVTITAVPEPGTLLLVGAGLLGLAMTGRRPSQA